MIIETNSISNKLVKKRVYVALTVRTPLWANYVAMDKDKKWFAYECKPYAVVSGEGSGKWYFDGRRVKVTLEVDTSDCIWNRTMFSLIDYPL